jgi:hypothetical protein
VNASSPPPRPRLPRWGTTLRSHRDHRPGERRSRQCRVIAQPRAATWCACASLKPSNSSFASSAVSGSGTSAYLRVKLNHSLLRRFAGSLAPFVQPQDYFQSPWYASHKIPDRLSGKRQQRGASCESAVMERRAMPLVAPQTAAILELDAEREARQFGPHVVPAHASLEARIGAMAKRWALHSPDELEHAIEAAGRDPGAWLDLVGGDERRHQQAYEQFARIGPQ